MIGQFVAVSCCLSVCQVCSVHKALGRVHFPLDETHRRVQTVGDGVLMSLLQWNTYPLQRLLSSATRTHGHVYDYPVGRL